jgi:hypothetical protein
MTAALVWAKSDATGDFGRFALTSAMSPAEQRRSGFRSDGAGELSSSEAICLVAAHRTPSSVTAVSPGGP